VPQLRYLPLVGAATCRQALRVLDVVLLLDASTTMRRPSADGRPRIEVAADAARALARRLMGPERGVRLGVVAFDESPRTLLEPTTELETVLARLAQPVGTARGSRIDRGLRHAAQVLADLPPSLGGRSQPVLILLSDGQAVGVSDAEVLQAAAISRSAGVEIWSLALGDDARGELLAAIAGAPQRRVDVVDETALSAMLRGLAGRLACP
jgi:Mg-chelatase subunit ChlD